jgi:uncharacterized protein YndB with AHSA1/START domain
VEVVREVLFEAPPEEVWAALTEAEQLERWFASEVEIEPVEGGHAVFCWGNGERREALVEEVEEEQALGLRWLDDGGSVRLELERLPDGTRLRVTESTPEFSTALGLQAMAACMVA